MIQKRNPILSKCRSIRVCMQGLSSAQGDREEKNFLRRFQDNEPGEYAVVDMFGQLRGVLTWTGKALTAYRIVKV